MTHANIDAGFELFNSRVYNAEARGLLEDAHSNMVDSQKAFAAAQETKDDREYQSEMLTAQYHEQRATNILLLFTALKNVNLV